MPWVPGLAWCTDEADSLSASASSKLYTNPVVACTTKQLVSSFSTSLHAGACCLWVSLSWARQTSKGHTLQGNV